MELASPIFIKFKNNDKNIW